MIWFWYGAFALILMVGIAAGVRRTMFAPASEASAPTSDTPSLLGRVYGWFGVGDIDEDLALAATLCTTGITSLALHAIAHLVMHSYPGWFGLLALATGFGAGVGMARLLSRGARGAW